MIVQINGIPLHYELSGSGERVLLLHGWGCDLSLMAPVSQRLQDSFQVLSLDFPAHGQSGRPDEPWGVPEFAECLRALLTQLSFTPCAVIAHSFGARVAVWMSAHYPESFTRLVLTGAAGIVPPRSEASRKRGEHYRKLKKIYGGIKNIPGLSGLADSLLHRAQQKYGSADYNALDDEMKKTFVKVISLDLSELYPRIVQPTLLVWGTEDTETPLWMGEKMEQWIPDAGLVRLEGGTHFAYLEQVERFVLIVRTFLQGA